MSLNMSGEQTVVEIIHEYSFEAKSRFHFDSIHDYPFSLFAINWVLKIYYCKHMQEIYILLPIPLNKILSACFQANLIFQG